jgi:hypothetical protein
MCLVIAGCGGGGGGDDGGSVPIPPAQPPAPPQNTSAQSLAEVLEDSASPGGARNANGVRVTAAQLAAIDGVTQVATANEGAYQEAILSEVGFSNPVAAAQIQRIINSVNAFADVANGVNTGDTGSISAAQLQAIDGIEAVLPSLVPLYQQGLANFVPNSLTNPAQLQFVINVVNGDDADDDGLSNQAEARGLAVTLGQETRVFLTDPRSADTDGDGLQDGYELYWSLGNTPSQLNAAPPDTNGDTVAGTQRDAIVAAANGVPERARVGLIDQDGDGLPRDAGIPWYDGVSWRFVSTDPLKQDSDDDKLFDAAEAGLQLTFRLYRGFDQAAGIRVLQQLNPVQATALWLGTDYPTEASLETDSDGGGRGDIEEWWAGTNPALGSDDQPFRGCTDAGPPAPTGTRGGCTESAEWATMTAANFRFAPGGFDVNDDGIVETGFWVSQFEARSAGAGAARDPAPEQGGASLAAYLSTHFRAYSFLSRQFDQRLCIDGGYLPDRNRDGITTPGTLPPVCRQSEYPKLGWNILNNPTASGAGISSPRLTFAPTLLPLTEKTSIEANIGLADSPVAGLAIELPDSVDWMQLVALVMHDERNWTAPNGNGVADTGDGVIFRGHTDDQNSNGNGVSALAVNAADPDDYTQGYDGTGDGSEFDTFPDSRNDIDQRRTLVLANGTAGRDFSLPLGHAVVIWDLAGNVAEWTHDLIAARRESSITSTRFGGDRFLGGAAGWNEFDSQAVTTSPMPAWWKPVLPHIEDRIINSTQGAGSYLDGLSADGAAFLQGSTYGSDYASIRRGGQWGNRGAISRSGIATTSVENGPDDRRLGIGFRAVRRP